MKSRFDPPDDVGGGSFFELTVDMIHPNHEEVAYKLESTYGVSYDVRQPRRYSFSTNCSRISRKPKRRSAYPALDEDDTGYDNLGCNHPYLYNGHTPDYWNGDDECGDSESDPEYERRQWEYGGYGYL